MRGTRLRRLRARPPGGIIPAYAGNTRTSARIHVLSWDHPRVCGEHPYLSAYPRALMGSSPRMRGTPAMCGAFLCREGIIPAYAGNTGLGWASPPCASGIIPAYAGNTSINARFCSADRDHPRVCGEHYGAESDTEELEGSSPRMRGTPKRLA